MEENMAKKKQPTGILPSRQPERQTKHPTSCSVPLATPSDEQLQDLMAMVWVLVLVGKSHWTADEIRSRVIDAVKQAFDNEPSDCYRVLQGSKTTSGEPELYCSFAAAIRYAMKVTGFDRTDELAREVVVAMSQRVIEAALVEAVPADIGIENIHLVYGRDFE
jgi:hypothetical protein